MPVDPDAHPGAATETGSAGASETEADCASGFEFISLSSSQLSGSVSGSSGLKSELTCD